jgi:HK97 family phage major capsid protein
MMSIPLTNDMIEDANFPVVSYISGKFAETIELLRDDRVLNGSGLGQPTGILVNPGADSNQPAVITSGSASAITAAMFPNLAFALPEQYDDNAKWVMAKTTTGQALANLTDNNGRFLWGAGLQDSGLAPGWKDRMLEGYPIIWSGFMPGPGSSTYPVVFGDLRGYYLVNRIGFSVQVLREIYAETNQILILGRIRFGGLCAEPWKLKVGQCHS